MKKALISLMIITFFLSFIHSADAMYGEHLIESPWGKTKKSIESEEDSSRKKVNRIGETEEVLYSYPEYSMIVKYYFFDNNLLGGIISNQIAQDDPEIRYKMLVRDLNDAFGKGDSNPGGARVNSVLHSCFDICSLPYDDNVRSGFTKAQNIWENENTTVVLLLSSGYDCRLYIFASQKRANEIKQVIRENKDKVAIAEANQRNPVSSIQKEIKYCTKTNRDEILFNTIKWGENDSVVQKVAFPDSKDIVVTDNGYSRTIQVKGIEIADHKTDVLNCYFTFEPTDNTINMNNPHLYCAEYIFSDDDEHIASDDLLNKLIKLYGKADVSKTEGKSRRSTWYGKNNTKLMFENYGNQIVIQYDWLDGELMKLNVEALNEERQDSEQKKVYSDSTEGL